MKMIGKFEILAELGQGAMGTVYRARDPILDREVALKTVSTVLLARPEARIRFQREAQAAARLQHPNIVTIFELGEAAGSLYIAMELLDGMDLAEAMTPPNRLSLDRKLRVVLDICHGLDFAHKRGVVHRDMKPANVRVLPDGRVKIVDFGIARLGDSQLTQAGLVLGTPSYIAPEMLLEGSADHRADIWAVGVILYELLAGKRPFEGPTIASLAYSVIHEPLPPLDPGLLRPGLGDVIARALQKDRAARYQDLAEMAVGLEKVMGLATSVTAPLPVDARQKAALRLLLEARHMADAGDPESALEAARRARSLAPALTAVIDLIRELEQRLSDTPTVPMARLIPPAALATAPASTSPPGLPPPAATPVRLPTPVLTELRVRGAAAFRELATFGEPPATQATCLAPNGMLLATAGIDGAIRLWDLHSRTRVTTLRSEMHRRTGHDALGLCLAFSRDGSLLASGHVDGSVHLWDVARTEELPVKLRHDDLVGALAFSSDGKTLASGGMDANVKLWDLAAVREGEARREMWRQPAGVTALCYVSDGAVLITGHANRILRVLDASTGRLLATLRGPEAAVNLLCPTPDGKRLAVGSQDRAVRLYDVESRSLVFALEAQKKPTSGLAFFAESTHMASVAQDNSVSLWDLESRSAIAALWGKAEESFAGIALFGAGDHIAVALADGRIRVWGPSV